MILKKKKITNFNQKIATTSNNTIIPQKIKGKQNFKQQVCDIKIAITNKKMETKIILKFGPLYINKNIISRTSSLQKYIITCMLAKKIEGLPIKQSLRIKFWSW